MTALSDLTTKIQQFCETTETTFVANIPTFIRASEERILNTADLPALRKTSTRSIASGIKYVGLPTDFISAFSVAITPASGVTSYIENKDINYIREAYPNSTTQGVPTVYALFDDTNMLIAPTADATYTLELNYFAKPASLVDNASGTWLATNYNAALLYGALVNANAYLKGEQDIQAMYETQFQAHLLPLVNVAKNKTRKDAYRSGQQRTEGPQ